MKFKVSEDVDAPADLTWARFTDFSLVEAEISRHGAEVTRVGDWTTPAEGCVWRGTVPIRGRVKPVTSIIATLLEPDRCQVDSMIGGMESQYQMTFLPLRTDMTRVQVVLDLSAGTLSARLALQTLKLAQRKVVQRMHGLLMRQGKLAEEAYRSARV